MDIGGFCVENRYVAGQMEFNKTGRENADYKEWRELNTRWYQFGAFCPLFRAHGQSPYREVWNIAPAGHPCYNSIVYYTKLRYNICLLYTSGIYRLCSSDSRSCFLFTLCRTTPPSSSHLPLSGGF